MYGEKAIELINELELAADTFPPYNKVQVEDVKSEICDLIEENQQDAQLNESNPSNNTSSSSYLPTVILRHKAVQRNVRCLLAYHYHRLKEIRRMRWAFGNALPDEMKNHFSQMEIEWYKNYSNNLGKYMRSLGENGLNLAVDVQPPKSIYVEVRCVTDYGNYELNDGSIVLLKKNTRHFLPRGECEEMIKHGVFEHVE